MLDLNGEPRTVVGVLSEGFYFPTPASEFWIPFVIPPFTPPVQAATEQPQVVLLLAFSALGRLAAGVLPEQATAEASTLLQGDGVASRMLPAIAAARGAAGRSENAARVVPLLEEMVGEYRPALLALTVATVLVLLNRLHQRGGAAVGTGSDAPAGARG